MESEDKFSNDMSQESKARYSSENNSIKRLRDRVHTLKEKFNAIKVTDYIDDGTVDDDDFIENPKIMHNGHYDFMKPSESTTLKDEVELLRFDINAMKASNRDAKGGDSNFEDENVLTVPEDTYSFIMLMPCSLPALVAWCVFIIQMSTYFLSIEDSLGISIGDDDLKPTPLLGIPRGNDIVVKVGQGFAILIVGIVQTSCWEAFSLLYYGYNPSLQIYGGFSYKWWLLANICRLFEGFFGTFVVFVLVVRSSNVVDLLKDFTALTFMSELHGIAFGLAGLGFMGRRLRAAAEECKNFAVEDILSPRGVNSKKYCLPIVKCKPYIFGHKINRHFLSMCITMTAMFLTWTFLCLIPQSNMTFLCQSVYVQLDDNINNKLGFFSGYYDLKPRSSNFIQRILHEEVTYKERRGLDLDKQPMVLKFCSSSSTWVFAMESKENPEEECNDDNIVAQSDFAEDEQHYNLMEIDNSAWSALNEDGRMLPMSDFIMSCADALNKEDYNTEFSMCDHIQVDTSKNFEVFSGTKEWSTDYFTYNSTDSDGRAMLYEHPIFLSKPVESQFDIIIFTGARWIFTSSLLIKNFDYTVNDTDANEKRIHLLKYLEKDFHGYWSDYTAEFFSQSVNKEKPIERMSPVRLNWYFSTLTVHSLPNAAVAQKTEFPDFERQQKSSFLCALCDNQTNPCQFSNTCNLNKTCVCTTGSTGTLCQDPPTGNGLCDDYFNFLKYEYDGGDCCVHSCVSGEYGCGLDKSGKYYAGYDQCKPKVPKGTYVEGEPLTLSGFQINEVHISPNGKFLVVTVVQTKVAQFYDADGSRWIMRQETLEFDSQSDHILQIANPAHAIKTGRFPPATVTITRGSDIYIYDWDYESYFWIETQLQTDQTSPQKTQKIKHVELVREGNILGVLKFDGSFEIYERLFYLSEWKLSPKRKIPSDAILGGKLKSFSLSENGNYILIATESCILVHNFRDKSNVYEKVCHNETIKSIKISPSGLTAAVISVVRGFEAQIHVYNINIEKNTLGLIDRKIRGVESEGVVQNVVEEEDCTKRIDCVVTILTHANMKTESRIIFYRFSPKNNEWQVIKQFNDTEKLVESFDGTVIAKYSRWKESLKGNGGGGEIRFFHTKNSTIDTFDKYHFTLQIDKRPKEVFWQIIKVSGISENNLQALETQKIYGVMMEGGPYNSSMILTRSISISSSDCLVLKMTDFGLEGLTTPGYVGFVINKTVAWKIENINGYENYFALSSDDDINKKCKKVIEKKAPWQKYNVLIHSMCQKTQCKWNLVGSKLPYVEELKEFTPIISLSADGSVMAVSSGTSSTLLNRVSATGVFKFSYDDKNWIPMGEHILLEDQNENYWVRNSLELSASGTTLVIGSIWEEDKNIPGMVRVFRYDELDNDWISLGNSTISSKSQWFGFSTSISSDGTTIAVASGGSSSCFAHVYDYVENSWFERGNCFKMDKIVMKPHCVKLSSNGLILAIGIPFHQEGEEIVGSVKVFEFDSLREVWDTIGDSFLGDKSGDFIGSSVSLSADGRVLAFSGRLNSPIKVFVFNEQIRSWHQRGHNISFPFRPGIISDNKVHLSSNGSIIIVSTFNMNHVFIWDDLLQEWIDAVHQFPDLNWITTAFSADAVTVAVMHHNKMDQNGKIDVFRLDYDNTSVCENSDDVLFNFTIIPDKFQEDIEWFLKNKNDQVIIGGGLSRTKSDNRSALVFTQCVSNNQKNYYLFEINDKYGDGICCNWGKGIFQVHWGDALVLNETNFTSKVSKFFPPSLVFANLGIRLRIESGEDDVIHVVVRNVQHLVFIEEKVQGNDITYKKDWDLVANECLNVLIYNDTVNKGKVDFEITWDSKVIASREKENVFEKFRLGNCDDQICEQGLIDFEIDILTNNHPSDFAWLLKTKDSVISGFDMYNNVNYYYFHRACVPDKGCLILQLFDNAFNNESVHYAVNIYEGSHNLSLNDEIQVKYKEHILRDCPATQCDTGFTLLQFDFGTNLFPDQFTWSLTNSTGHQLMGQAGYKQKFKYHQYEICIPVSDCAKFAVSSYGEGYLAFYSLKWANEIYAERGKPGYQNATYNIFCGD